MNILDSLRIPPPTVVADDVARIAADEFGLTGTIKTLGGERDRNFLISDAQGRVLLKFANPVEDDQILAMQCGAIEHIAKYCPHVAVSRLIRDRKNQQWATALLHDGKNLRVRAFTFLEGNPIEQGTENSNLLNNLGKSIAELNIALGGYFHPAARHPLAWNSQCFGELGHLVQLIESPMQRELVSDVLHRFNDFVKPLLPVCRAQLIHNDICFHNSVVAENSPDQIAGIFDFGDMVYGPIIQDLSNPAAEVPAGSTNALLHSAEIIAGFHQTLPLLDIEFRLLPDMIATRLAMCILLDAWARSENDWEDDRGHLDGWHEKSVDMLQQLHQQPERQFEALIRSVCDAPDKTQSSIRKSSEFELEKRNRYLGNASYFAYDKPIHMVRGEGVWLYDSDGKKYLDAYNNVPHAGHCHPKISAAIASQTGLLNTNTRYMYDVANEYAERISGKLPEGLDACYFVSSGSEANDLAWRLATAWTGNTGGLVLDNAYHGITETTYALSPAENKLSNQTFPQIGLLEAPDDFRGPWKRDDLQRGEKYANRAIETIEQLASRGHQPAALYLDMIMSSNGVITPQPGYLERIFEIVRNAGGLCIADEVQSGFGRSGKHWWGFEFGDVTPDIVTFGKPIAGGYPMGLVVTRRDIADRFENEGDFFSTTGGNPVACAAALAMLDVIEEEELIDNANNVGGLLKEGIAALADRHTLIGDVRGSGLFIGVELVKDQQTQSPATRETKLVVNRMKDAGVLIGQDGIYQNVLKIRPPMPVNEQQVKTIIDTLDSVLGNF